MLLQKTSQEARILRCVHEQHPNRSVPEMRLHLRDGMRCRHCKHEQAAPTPSEPAEDEDPVGTAMAQVCYGEIMPHMEAYQAAQGSSTLHRVPAAVAARHEVLREVLEPAIRERDSIPEGTATIQLGLDGVMVPMEGKHARPRGRKTETAEPPRHETRYGPMGGGAANDTDAAIGRAWHEASVGTVSFLDVEGNRRAAMMWGAPGAPFCLAGSCHDKCPRRGCGDLESNRDGG